MVAGQIGIDDYRIAIGQARRAIGIGDHAGEFVAHDAGIFEEGVLALEDMIIGAANADMADGDADPAGLQRRRRDIDQRQLARSRTGNGTHESPPSM